MRTICLLSPSIYAQATAHPHPQRMGDISGAVLVGGSLCLRSGRKICEGNVGLIDFQGQKMLWMSMLTILRKLELGRREEKKKTSGRDQDKLLNIQDSRVRVCREADMKRRVKMGKG